MNTSVPLPRAQHITRNTAIHSISALTRDRLLAERCSSEHADTTVPLES